MSRRVRGVMMAMAFAIGLAVLFSGPSQGAISAGARRIYLPSVRVYNPYPLERGTQLRLDNIAMSTLDTALRNFGIASAAHRATIIQQEQERRAQGLIRPEERKHPLPTVPDDTANAAYPAPDPGRAPVPQGAGPYVRTWCQVGDGVFGTYEGAGNLTSRWFEYWLGHTAWAPAIPCPIGRWCTVLARAPATSHRDIRWQREWTHGQALSSVGPPVWVTPFTCFAAQT